MELPIVKANIVVIRGVFLDDVRRHKTNARGGFRCNSTALQAFGGADTIDTENIFAYSKIPTRFEGAATWPTFTNLKCWECDQLPAAYPAFLPVNPEKKDGHYECDVVGNFCCWNCAARYAGRELTKDKLWDSLKCICIFEAEFTGSRAREKIMPAPPKTLMRPYCGNRGITAAEWRERVNQLNADYNMVSLKLTHSTNDP
jgi:hypothetical protein